MPRWPRRRACLKPGPATGHLRTKGCSRPRPHVPSKVRPENKKDGQTAVLPPALDRTSRPRNQKSPQQRLRCHFPRIPNEASLDEIAATGKPLTLPEAIKLAFRYQPRLHAQVEHVAQARGRSRLHFRRSCRWSPRITTLASIAWEWVANRFDWERACRDSTSCLGWEPYPTVSTPGRISSSPSSKFNGCSSTSVAGWVVTSSPDWRTTSLSFRPTVRTKRWPMTLQSPTTMS